MRLRTATTAALAAALGLASLTGCGSSGTKPAAGSPSGATTAPTTPGHPPTGSSTSTPAPAPDNPAPAVQLPADFTITTDPDTTGDAVKDAVLRDNERMWQAYYTAVNLGQSMPPVLKKYVEGEGAVAMAKGISDLLDGGWTVTGTDRFYQRTVTMTGAASATVSACEDQSKAYGKARKSGKVNVTQPSDKSYNLYSMNVQKTADGTWQVMQIHALAGTPCH